MSYDKKNKLHMLKNVYKNLQESNDVLKKKMSKNLETMKNIEKEVKKIEKELSDEQ